MALKSIIKAVLPFAFLAFIACDERNEGLEMVLQNPVHDISSHPLHTQKSIKMKIGRIPDNVLDQIKKWDEDSSYLPFDPDTGMISAMEIMISQLPNLNRKAMEERLAGIYFIKGFRSKGMTDFARDSSGILHFYFVFNADLLKTNVEESANQRLNTCFKEDSSDAEITVESSDSILAFMATLLHETTHAVDLVYQITPFLYPLFSGIDISSDTNFLFTRSCWLDYSLPAKPSDFWGRDSITFYGFNNGPKLQKSNAKNLLFYFQESPFASLYGSMNWAEDLAEMVTWYHLTNVMKTEYKIVLKTDGEPYFEYEPMKSEKVKNRIQYIQRFYDEQQSPPPVVGFGLKDGCNKM
jgi:hypothetical protein